MSYKLAYRLDIAIPRVENYVLLSILNNIDTTDIIFILNFFIKLGYNDCNDKGSDLYVTIKNKHKSKYKLVMKK